jgi:hypothetical protein
VHVDAYVVTYASVGIEGNEVGIEGNEVKMDGEIVWRG